MPAIQIALSARIHAAPEALGPGGGLRSDEHLAMRRRIQARGISGFIAAASFVFLCGLQLTPGGRSLYRTQRDLSASRIVKSPYFPGTVP
jgi:hypothetical protein